MLPEEGIFEPAPPIDQRGHTGVVTITIPENTHLDLITQVPPGFIEGWASITPPASTNTSGNGTTDYVSFTNESTAVWVNGPTTVVLYWK